MTNDPPARTARRRISLAVLALAIIGVGLAVHRGVGGALGDIAGDALYAGLIYVLAAFALPRWRSSALAAVAFTVCGAIELLQLTGLPREWASVFPPIELVLGSGFDVRDIVVYAVAASAAALIDHMLTRTFAGRVPRNATGRPPEGERPV